jgi:hypothetical protein
MGQENVCTIVQEEEFEAAGVGVHKLGKYHDEDGVRLM